MATQDAIAVLRADHATARRLFKEFSAAGDRAHATRRRIVDRIITELSVHAGIEETVFYPRVRAALPKVETDVLEALEEHHIVKTTCAELETMNPRDERFAAKVQVLSENVTHHMKEEETGLFPEVRRLFSRADLLTMGEDLRAARSAVPTRPHPHAPDEPPGNIAAALVSTPVDEVVKTVRGAVERGRRAVSG